MTLLPRVFFGRGKSAGLGDDDLGYYETKTDIVVIDLEQDSIDKFKTLLHELGHALIERIPFKDRETIHRLYDWFTNRKNIDIVVLTPCIKKE